MIKFKKRSIILLSVFTFLIVFVIAFIYTSLGLRIVSFALEKYMPQVKIERIEGALYNFEVSGFSMNMDGVEVKLDDAAIAISGLCLLEGKVCIKNLEAENVIVNVDTSKFQSDPEPVPDSSNDAPTVIKTPIAIELRNAILNGVNVTVDDMQFGLDSFNGKATWVKNQLVVFPSSAQGVKAIFPDNTASKPTPKSESDLSLEETLQNFLSQPLITSLPDVNIPINVVVSELKGDNWLLHMGSDYRFNNLTIRGSIIDGDILLPKVEADIVNPYQHVYALIRGNILMAKQWPLSAQITLKTLPDNDGDVTTVKSSVSGNIIGLVSSKTQVTGSNQLNLDANINFIEKFLPLKLKLTGQHIQWPLTGQAQYQLNDFDLALSGMTRQMQLTGKGAFKGQDLPDTNFNLNAKGNNSSIVLDQLRVQFPQGKIDAIGNVDWSNTVKWDAQVTFDQINLPSQIPEFPLNLDGQIKTQGWLDKQQRWEINTSELKLDGMVRQAPLHLSGALMANSKMQLSAEKLKLIWGNNTLDLNGSMQNQNTLRADIDMPKLSVFLSGLAGEIKGHFNLAGTLLEPNIDTDLTVQNFAFNGISVNRIILNGHTHYDKQIDGDITLQATSLLYSDSITARDIEVRLAGSEQNHTLAINLDGEPIAGSLNLEGHLTKNRTLWSGQLVNSSIETPIKTWTLNHPLVLSYELNKPKIMIGEHCWVNGDSNLCLTKDVVVTNKGSADITLKNLDLALFDLFLSGDTQVMGALSGNANIQWSENQTFPIVKANINSDEVYIKQSIVSQTLTIPFDIFNIDLNLNNQEAKLNWHLSLKEYGDISGLVRILDPANQQRLAGNLDIDKLSLSIFTPMLQGDDYANGLIQSRLNFGGSLSSPTITGKLTLNQSDIKASQLPADIQSVSLEMNFLGRSSTLQGAIKTHQGDINLNGQADWKNTDKWQAKLSVKGDGMDIALPPMIAMTIVPDITITANQDQIDLGGRVSIPKARIKVESLPESIVDVSTDEVMLNDNLEVVTQQALPMQINSNIMVVIGDDVQIDAFGLNANLSGRLFVKQNRQGLGLHGQILIPNGRFHAYGQDLVIQKGELIFAGPVDQPQLNIEAIRNPNSVANNVTAGIRVTGLADNPTVELFSDPTMSEQETLSYILRGQGLESSDQGENDMMTAILIGLGTAQGGKYIGNIGEMFGIKDLSLDTQGVGNNSQVVVSGYILPNLQVKYGVGIFDSLAIFTLRYRLMPKLYLEAVSGLSQSVDLLYQFEF